MHKFIAKHQDQISGVLSGFDRLVLRGTLRSIAHAAGMNQYLYDSEILLKNFGSHVEQVSQRLKSASLAEAAAAHRPVRYLASSALSKEDIARRISAEDGITNLRDLSQPRHQTPAAPTACPQVPVPVPLRGAPGLRLPECPHSKLVSLFDPDLSQRPGVAGTPDERSRSGLRASRQLFSLDRRLVDGATADLHHRRAGHKGRLRAVVDPDARQR